MLDFLLICKSQAIKAKKEQEAEITYLDMDSSCENWSVMSRLETRLQGLVAVYDLTGDYV